MNRTNSEHKMQALKFPVGGMSREEILNLMYSAAGLPLIEVPPKTSQPRMDVSHDPAFPDRVAKGAKLRKTLAPFVPSPLLDMLVLGRIMGWYPDPRDPSSQFHGPSVVEGLLGGNPPLSRDVPPAPISPRDGMKNPTVLKAETTGDLRPANEGTEFTTTPPAWYPAFRDANPDYRVHQFMAEQNSAPADNFWGWWHGGDEWSLQTWRDRKTGALDYTLAQGHGNRTDAYASRPGYDLLITEHWHPFPNGPENAGDALKGVFMQRKYTPPGPSAGPKSDVEGAYLPGFRDGLSIVHSLKGKDSFYGPNAGLRK